MFGKLDKNPEYPAMEHRILRFWDEKHIFEKLRRKNQDKPSFSFIDGPITANNPMGVHHAWGRTYKDIFQRFRAMKGCNLRYQNGFDCQGLWVEVEVEGELGFKTKRDIEDYGIDRFVEQCKERVRKFAAIQTKQSIRLGYWMDWDNSYYTMSDENNYTIWLFLRKCHENGWIYKGHDVMPWCPRCGTAISNMEIATEGYREMTHESVVVRMPLVENPDTFLLVWTTTPWTLPANAAVAVHPDLNYARVQQGDRFYILGDTALSSGNWIQGEYELKEKFPGRALVGKKYKTVFEDLPVQKGIEHPVIPWKEVSDEEGTGMVHIAPGCGKEDFALGREFQLQVLAPLDEEGCYVEGYGPFSTHRVSDLTRDIIQELKERDFLYHTMKCIHRYPVCWRCGNELLFRLVDEWFISMEELRHRIMKLVPTVNWIPDFCLEREMDWLRNMDDWCISKKRYWGLALPIYECRCGHFDVIGSREELQNRAVCGWETFENHSPHKPFIDAVKIPCERCGGVAGRIPDVGNPWLDAGIVPFSTLNYTKDNTYWSQWFPADFVTECFPGQFRNWFYALLTMSTVLEGCAPFKNLLGHALVRDEKGEEMHKSKGNAIWFEDAAEKMGADVMRWIFASQNVAVNLCFGWNKGREVRRKLMTLWNVASFFITYADIEKPELGNISPNDLSLMDRWILSLTQSLAKKVTSSLERYDCASAIGAFETFIEDLSTWYVRRSRRRFWKSDQDQDKAAAYNTLYEALMTCVKLLAPILPFSSEEIYQALAFPDEEAHGESSTTLESVHLCDWPEIKEEFIDTKLEEDMRVVMEITRLGLSMRNKSRIKVRQPLNRLFVFTNDPRIKSALEQFRDTIMEEMNIKELVLGEGNTARHGEKDQTGFEFMEGSGATLALETTITRDLQMEGIARDFVRHVQEFRKSCGLSVQDRISIHVSCSGIVKEAISQFSQYIRNETLALEMGFREPEFVHWMECKLAEQKVCVGLLKIA